MPHLLIAALALSQAQAAAQLSVPYKDNDATDYKVTIAISDQGQEVNVEMDAHYKIAKKTDKGFEGTFGWTNLHVDSADQPDESFNLVLKTNGMIKSVDSTYGPPMRRMLMPFFMVYPGKAVEKGGTWTYEDEKADETDGHTATIEYKVVGPETVKEKPGTKVEFKITEHGSDPMKADGWYIVGADGRVLKFELNVGNWQVPMAGQAFDAKIKGDLVSK